MARTIMIVDDDLVVRSSVKKILQKNGFDAVTAENSDKCLEILRRQKVDLILIDILMPGTPVCDVVMRERDTKIMYITGLKVPPKEKKHMLKHSNVVDIIKKPFDVDDFLNRIKKALGEQDSKS